jgi:hypothetical protein
MFLLWVLDNIYVFVRLRLFLVFLYNIIISLQVACQSLGPLKNGGAVVGIDLKVCSSLALCISGFDFGHCVETVIFFGIEEVKVGLL